MAATLLKGRPVAKTITEEVARDVSVLKQAGIVDDRKEGVMTYYRLKIGCLEGFWSCIESVLKGNLRDQQAAIGG